MSKPTILGYALKLQTLKPPTLQEKALFFSLHYATDCLQFLKISRSKALAGDCV
jgi:hypothetical protein